MRDAPPQRPTSADAARLGVASAGALVVANMIGSGVFTTSGYALADLGTTARVLAAWAVGGAVATCGALSYSALARRFPESGGEYTLLTRTVHPLAGFLAGWVSLFAGFTAPIAVNALLLQAYLAPWIGERFRPEWLGTAAILVAALLHAGRSGGVAVQNVSVALKLLLIAGLIAVGLLRGQAGFDNALPDAGAFDLGAFAVSLVWISFAYSGWNAVVYVAGEVRAPERTLARSTIGATLLVTLVYLGLNAVFLTAAPATELAGRPDIGGAAAAAIAGAAGHAVVSAVVALALATSISGMVMAGPRVYARMAEDGLFPALFAPHGRVPTAAVLLQGALAIVVVWSSGLRELLSYVGFTLGLSAAATVVGLVLQRRREGPARVPVPGWPWVPAIYLVATLGASGFLVALEGRNALWGLATIAAGVPVWFALRWRAPRDRRSAPPGGR